MFKTMVNCKLIRVVLADTRCLSLSVDSVTTECLRARILNYFHVLIGQLSRTTK